MAKGDKKRRGRRKRSKPEAEADALVEFDEEPEAPPTEEEEAARAPLPALIEKPKRPSGPPVVNNQRLMTSRLHRKLAAGPPGGVPANEVVFEAAPELGAMPSPVALPTGAVEPTNDTEPGLPKSPGLATFEPPSWPGVPSDAAPSDANSEPEPSPPVVDDLSDRGSEANEAETPADATPLFSPVPDSPGLGAAFAFPAPAGDPQEIAESVAASPLPEVPKAPRDSDSGSIWGESHVAEPADDAEGLEPAEMFVAADVSPAVAPGSTLPATRSSSEVETTGGSIWGSVSAESDAPTDKVDPSSLWASGDSGLQPAEPEDEVVEPRSASAEDLFVDRSLQSALAPRQD